MITFYKYTYYCIYKFIEFIGLSDILEWSATFMMCLINIANLLFILDLYRANFNPDFPFLSHKASTIIGVLILINNYFIFLFNNKYKIILNNFDANNKGTTSSFLVVLYIVFSILSIFLFPPKLENSNEGRIIPYQSQF